MASTLLDAALAAGLDVFTWLGTDAGGLVVWGITLRCFYSIMAFHFFSIAWQIVPWAGVRGVSPSRDLLRAFLRDYGLRALLYWPTLLWPVVLLPPSLSDAFLLATPLAGMSLALACVIHGCGAASGPACLAMYAINVSIDSGAHSLAYPWDSLSMEALFLSAFMPPLAPVWASPATVTALPTPLLVWCFRWSITRLLVGFGKLKFIGSGKEDNQYIKHFLISQPIVSWPGLLMHKFMPSLLWYVSLMGMFVVEIPLPLAAFLTPNGAIGSAVRVATTLAVCGLMAGIQVTGNFGFFNVITAVMFLPFLHHTASIFDLDLHAHILSSPAHTAFALLFITYMLPASCLAFIMNSWMNLGWTHWPGLHSLKPTWLFTHVVAVVRALSQLRIIQAFGVFPPNSFPGQRYVARYEVSLPKRVDVAAPTGMSTHPLPAYYFDAACTSVAPYHPRLDHAIFYESMGVTGYGYANILGHHSPYKVGLENSEWVRLQRRIADAYVPTTSPDAECVLRLLQPNTAAHAQAASIAAAVASRTGGVRVIDGHYWPPRDRASNSAFAARGWKYVCPAARVDIALIHQVPDHESALLPTLKHTRVGLHATPVIPYHIVHNCSEYALIRDEYFEALSGATYRGVHDFPWDFAFWRRAAVRTVKPADVPTAEIDEVWSFVAAVRAAAVAAARERVTSPALPAAARPHACSTKHNATHTPLSDISAAAHTVKRATPAALSAACDAAGKVAISTTVPASAADVIFTLTHTPAVAAHVRNTYSPLALARIRSNMNVLLTAMLERVEAVFWGVDGSALDADTCACGFKVSAMDAAWRALYARVEDMKNGTVAAVNVRKEEPHAVVNGKRYAAHVYAGNDDAQVEGCMRNHMRMHMLCAWTMLTQGRAAFEAACGAGASSTHSRACIVRTLMPSAEVGPHTMGTEAGLFLHTVMNYDVYATACRRGRVPGLHSRPRTSTHSPVSVGPLPGWLEVQERLAAHAEIRAWSPMHAWGCLPPEACVDAQGWVDDPSAPVWALDATGDWVLLHGPAPVLPAGSDAVVPASTSNNKSKKRE